MSGMAIMAIVSVCLLVLAAGLYLLENSVGIVPHLVGFVLTVALLATWLTDLSAQVWGEWGPVPVIGALVITAVALVVPLAALNIDSEV